MSGRRVCAWCGLDLGPAPGLASDKVTHGMCDRCADGLLAQLRAQPTVVPVNRRPPPSDAWDRECST